MSVHRKRADTSHHGAGELRLLRTMLFDVLLRHSQTYMQSLLRGVVADVGYVDSDTDTHLQR